MRLSLRPRPRIPRTAALGGAGLLVASLLLLWAGIGPGHASAAWQTETGLDYGEPPGRFGSLNQLDMYVPTGEASGPRPIVIYVHGGSWSGGDKGNNLADKVRLFTGAGYLFASINYRLSPKVTPEDPPDFSPTRLRFPVHAIDVARAVAWIGHNAHLYGGDPDSVLLIGHSAGAHLVSLVGTNPTYLEDRGFALEQIVGVIPLDTAAYSVTEDATLTAGSPTRRNQLFWHVFGTPAEEAADPRWEAASPLAHADRSDPRHLLITQSASPTRIAISQRMAAALGQGSTSVLRIPLDHGGINQAVGQPGDPTGESAAIMAFIAERVEAHPPFRVKVRKRPPRRARVGRKKARRKVVFKFRAQRPPAGYECRIDRKRFKACDGVRRFRLRRGRHVFRVRAVYPSGRTSPYREVRFRIYSKQR